MIDTIDYNTFAATLNAACTDAVRALPTLTPIYICVDGAKEWTDTGDYEDYHPVDPAGTFFSDFVKAKGGKPTKKHANAFVKQYGQMLYDIFCDYVDADLTHTDAMERELAAAFRKAKQEAKAARQGKGSKADQPANVALEGDGAPVDAPTGDDADVEPIVGDAEGNTEAADEPVQEEAAEVAAEAEQEAGVSEKVPSAPAVEQPRKRGPQAAPRVKMEAGAVNFRNYKGKAYEVRILADGKRCTVDGVEFSSLSSAALQMFELHVSGVKFWGFVR